jgi:pimeloyl-ACP methyl ester carboxylesterase
MPTRFAVSPLDSLTEPTSIALAQSIQCQPIPTPLSASAIATTFVRSVRPDENMPPILLLHGFDSSVLEFRRLLPLLAEQTHVWAVDLLGFGFTERQDKVAINPETIKLHLYCLWKTLIGQPVVLVGASMGGATAIDFTLTHPQAVQQLVLIDSAGWNAGPAIGKFLFPPLGYLATSFLSNLQVRQRISENAYSDPRWASPDALHCAALHLQQPRWRQALISFTRSGGYRSFRNQLDRLCLPTLILWGKGDRILGTADAEPLQAAIAHSQLFWIDDCGHVPHLEQPQMTAQHILDFMVARCSSATLC